jgi:hypothetical protein
MYNSYDVRVEYKGDVQWHNCHAFDSLEAKRDAIYFFRKSRRLTDTRKVPDSDLKVAITFSVEYD